MRETLVRGAPQTRQSSGKKRLKRAAEVLRSDEPSAAGTFPMERLLEKTHLP
jgi:hypothetical protein